MRNLILATSILFLISCASTSSIQAKTSNEIIEEAAIVLTKSVKGQPEEGSTSTVSVGDINYISYPSHGAIADKITIAAGGGRNALTLRNTLTKMENAGGGNAIISSTNPSLAKAVIKGALRSDDTYPHVTIFYVGKADDSAELKPIIEEKKITYYFIDAHKTKIKTKDK